jgi:hypothetical protein
MSERLNGLRKDEWANQSAPRGKAHEEETPAPAGAQGENPRMSDEKRPSLRGAARHGAEAKPQSAQTPPQRPKPPVVGVEQVVVRCGHTVPFELFDLKQDKYRNARRKKLTDAACRDCRLKVHEERTHAEMEAARKRRSERPKKERAPSGPENRLPDGARFDVAFDAAKGEWSGTLAVPGLAPLTASASGVFELLSVLDGMYRASPARGGATD